MGAIKIKSCVKQATVFQPKEEGWSETIDIRLNEEIDGYQFNEETGEKELTKVNHVSVFIGDIISAMCTDDSSISAFFAAKNREEKCKLIPVLLAGAHIEFNREHIENDKKIITDITKVVITDAMKERINRALDALLGF